MVTYQRPSITAELLSDVCPEQAKTILQLPRGSLLQAALVGATVAELFS
jgi:hypothetical protein